MPNQGVPVIFKNKIAYGYAEKSVQAYDVSVSDYNALTEQQQLDGSIRFIQGVDAIPNGSNVWAKLGTTPLAEGLPRDCSQAVNQLKSNLTDFGTLLSAILFVGGGIVSNLNNAQRVAGQITINTFTISASNKPTNSAGGYLFTFANTDSANFGCQVVVNNEGLYGRRIQNGTWQAWTTVKTWT